MDKICVVVVTYNRKELLVECLNRLLQIEHDNYEIIVVDNASNDGTREIVEKYRNNKLVYYNTGKNIGGAGGFNYGIKRALDRNAEYIWLMDDDTFVDRYALNVLIDVANKLQNQFGFLCSNVRWTDGSVCLMNKPAISGQWLDNSDLICDGVVQVDSASFVSFFLKTDVVKNVGLPIKEFFIWADDVEYSLRISKKFRSYCCINSTVVHAMSENKTTNILGESSLGRISRFYNRYRNRFYIVKKERSLKANFKFVLSSVYVCLKIAFGKGTFKLLKIRKVAGGVIAGIFFDPSVEYYGEKDDI